MSGGRPDDPLNQPTEELPALHHAEPGPATEPELAPEPGPEPVPGPVPEPVPPAFEPAPEPANAEPGPESASEPVPELAPEPVPESVPPAFEPGAAAAAAVPGPVPEPEPVPELVPGPAPEPAVTEPLPMPEASKTSVMDVNGGREPGQPNVRADTRTRRPRRWSRIGALVVVVVLVLAATAVGAELYARSRVEAVIRSALPGLSADATISTNGLVLPQVLGSRLNTLTIDADSLTLTRTASAGDDDAPTSVTLSDLDATLTGVSLAQPRTIDAVAVTGAVAWSEIAAIVRARVPRLPLDLTVRPDTLGSADDPGTMIATSPILGSDTSLVLKPGLMDDGGLVLSVIRATVRGIDFDLDDESASNQILGILGMEMPEITVGPEILPAGAALSGVAVAEKGLALTISGKNLSLEQF